MQPYLTVVIPAYNEEGGIERTLRRVIGFLRDQNWKFEVIVVDDGSTDKTAAVVQKFIKDRPEVRLIKNPHKGKGFAVRTGMLAAEGDFILFTDADLSTPIEEIKRLLLWLTEHDFDLAIGSREGIGARRENEPFYRHFLGRGFNFGVKLLLLRGIEDTQCGFKLFKKKAAKDIFSRLVLYGEEAPEVKEARVTAFDVEVLFLARKLGYKIKEVPITWRHVKTQRVHPLKDSFSMGWDVVKVWWNNLWGVYERNLE